MSSLAPQLKPMTAGDILDLAIRIYRHNFVPLVTIVAIVSLPVILFQVLFIALLLPFSLDSAALPNIGDDPTTLLGLGIFTYGASVLGGILVIFQNAALAWFVSERFLGREATIRRAYASAFRRWLSLLVAALLLGLAIGGLFLVLIGAGIVPIAAATAMGAGDGPSDAILGLVTLCLCVLFIPVGGCALFLYTRWTFWTQAIVLENYNSTGGMGRSWKLTRGTFLRVLGFNIILYVLVSFFSAGPILLVTFVSILLPSPALGAIVQTLATSIITLIVTPLQFAVLTILFYDLKIRKEGFDLELQLQDPAPINLSPLYSSSEQ